MREIQLRYEYFLMTIKKNSLFLFKKPGPESDFNFLT